MEKELIKCQENKVYFIETYFLKRKLTNAENWFNLVYNHRTAIYDSRIGNKPEIISLGKRKGFKEIKTIDVSKNDSNKT